jgi:hypothetical protein
MDDSTSSAAKKRKYTKNHFRLTKKGGRADWTKLPYELIGLIATAKCGPFTCRPFTGRLALTCSVFHNAIDAMWKARQAELAEGAFVLGKLIKPDEWLSLLDSRPLEELRFGIHLLSQGKSTKWDFERSYYTAVFDFKVNTYKLLPHAETVITNYTTGYRKITKSFFLVDETSDKTPQIITPLSRGRYYPTLYVDGECQTAEQELDLKFKVSPTEGCYWAEYSACRACHVVVKLLN